MQINQDSQCLEEEIITDIEDSKSVAETDVPYKNKIMMGYWIITDALDTKINQDVIWFNKQGNSPVIAVEAITLLNLVQISKKMQYTSRQDRFLFILIIEKDRN